MLGCMAEFLGALELVTAAQTDLPAQAPSQPSNGMLLAGVDAQAAALSTGDTWHIFRGGLLWLAFLMSSLVNYYTFVSPGGCCAQKSDVFFRASASCSQMQSPP